MTNQNFHGHWPLLLSTPSFLLGLIWTSLPKGDQERWTSKYPVPQDVLLGDNLYAERCPRLLHVEVVRGFVAEATVSGKCGGAIVYAQCASSGGSWSHFQLLLSYHRHIHRQHYKGMLEALSDGALYIHRPTVYSRLSWGEKPVYYTHHRYR